MFLIETPQQGVADVADTQLPPAAAKAHVVGTIKFSSCTKYKHTEDFRRDQHRHRILPNSRHDWADDRDRYAWEVSEVRRFAVPILSVGHNQIGYPSAKSVELQTPVPASAPINAAVLVPEAMDLETEYLAAATCREGVNGARDLRYTTNSALSTAHGARGLRNLGNTCYGNALLFALARIPSVRRWCKDHSETAVTPPLHGAQCPLCMLGHDISHLLRTERASSHVASCQMESRLR